MRVLSVGNCTLDHFGVVERFLEPDFKAELAKFSVQGGGSAATAVVALARWGVDTRFVGKVGDDARGQQIEQTLEGEGVDTAPMVRQAGAVSQFTYVTVESSTGRKKTFTTAGNVSALSADEVDPDVLDDVDLLLVDDTSPEAQLELMRAARERGIPVVFDASRNHRRVGDLVAHCDFLVASERFASEFAGVGQLESLCRALLERGPERVIVTLGDEGVVGMDRADGVLHREEAHPVEVVDTTGAGDVFVGAVAYGLIHDWDIDHILRFANAAAALSCTDVGARAAIRPIATIEAELG